MSSDLKRPYVDRKAEFADKTVEDLYKIREEIKNKLKEVETVLLDTSATSEAKATAAYTKKEVQNYRTRLYKRLRVLGVNCAEKRSELAAQKKELKAAASTAEVLPAAGPEPTV